MGRLSGVSVVITRPRSRSDALAAHLEGDGARVSVIPAIEIGPPRDGGDALAAAVSAADRDGWLAFTSANGVESFVAAATEARVLDTWADAPVAVVGPATARAAARLLGRPARVIADPPTAASLAAQITAPPRRVLVPGAEISRPDLAKGLSARGFEVDTVAAYATRPATFTPAGCAQLRDADVVVYASPSAVAAVVATVHPAGAAVAIGPVTADALADEGVAAVTASATDDGAVAEAVCAAAGR